MRRNEKGNWILSDEEMGKFALCAFETSRLYMCQGCFASALEAEKLANEICEVLELVGYLDD